MICASCKTVEFEKKLTLEEIEDKLKDTKDLEGTFNRLGERGARFVPDSWEMPTLYFAQDGRTLEIMTKDLDIGQVDELLCNLAQVLDCKILGEHQEYY
jgi:hypothetical protein